MLMTRVMPCLLLRGRALVKPVGFRKAAYIGDPINTVRIYNEKEVDELILLDIDVNAAERGPSYDLIREVASECFMPLVYGGGIRELPQIQRILALGAEKVSLNTAAVTKPDLVAAAARHFGSQSVVVSVDVKHTWLKGMCVCIHGGGRRCALDPVDHARRAEELGAGEILLTSIDREGSFGGYDVDLIRRVSTAVSIPVIANGGAGQLSDIRAAICEGGATAAALGSMAVYQNRRRAVLINFPSQREIHEVLRSEAPLAATGGDRCSDGEES